MYTHKPERGGGGPLEDVRMMTSRPVQEGGLKPWEKELVESQEVRRKATVAQLCESLWVSAGGRGGKGGREEGRRRWAERTRELNDHSTNFLSFRLCFHVQQTSLITTVSLIYLLSSFTYTFLS